MAILAGALWAAFAVELGDKTFAEHVDEISETPEAQQLVDDTRATINPALAEIRDRLLGEYVEAPTWIPEQDERDEQGQMSVPGDERRPGEADAIHASASGDASPEPPVIEPVIEPVIGDDYAPPLPGRR